MTVETAQAIKLFYCYAREDEKLRNELEKHLRRQSRIIGWHDRKIGAGIEWADEIDAHLSTADIILLLISPDFMNSEYCYSNEMKRALERHAAGEARVVPIILRPVYWNDAPFNTLKVLPSHGKAVTSWANVDEAFVEIASEVSKIVKDLEAQQAARFESQALEQTLIFLSSSRADGEIVARLKTDLQAQGINIWIDREGLEPGTPDWEEALRTAIRTAGAVLLAASPNARSSRYVKDELRIAEMYQRPVYPVWVAGNQWMEAVPLGWGGTQYIDAREGKYKRALPEIVTTLRKAPLRPHTPPKLDFEPRNPYKGLRAFTGEDAHDFFGRERLIDELTDALGNTLVVLKKSKQHLRLLTVVGPSGSGKSSIVMAGLLPRLQAGSLPGSEEWVYLRPIVPGTHPMESLTLAFSEHLSHRSLKAIREDLEDDSARGLHLLATSLGKRQGTRVVVFVDQFEELFTQTTDENERRRFIEALVTAMTEPQGPVIVLLTLRADFYDRPMHYPELGELIETHHKSVLPMELKDLRTVIEKPAQLPDVQLAFEGDLVGDLLFEVQGQAGALPLLQFTLAQLFEQRREHLLTLLAYREMGGVKGALAQHAESTYDALPTEEHRRLAHVLFLRLIDPGATEQDTTRRRAALTELSLPDTDQTNILRETADAFVAARLLITNTIAGISTLEISHEALIREWARLADWLVTNRSDILLQKTISEDAAEWMRRGKPADRAYRGAQLSESQAWAERNSPSIDEVAFLVASEEEREREEAGKRAQQARELDLQRRVAKRQQYVSGLMGVIAVVLVAALVLTLVLNQRTQTALTAYQQSAQANVTNLDDHGAGSLRDAVKTVPGGGVITFARNLTGGTITLKTGAITINKTLSIIGPGESLLTINGNDSDRIFTVSSGVFVTISNITITHGRHQSGAGISNNGTLTVSNSVISDNTLGGGISNNSSLVLINSAVSGNTVENTGGAFGGGIYNNGNLTLLDGSIVSVNFANRGAGIYNDYSGSLSLNNSMVVDNEARIAFNNLSTLGGGIYSNGQLTITSSIIAGNRAHYGGGIFNYYSGSLAIANSAIHDNTAAGITVDNSGKIGSSGDGGGIANDGFFTLNNSTVTNNTSYNGGAISNYNSGLLTITNSTVSHNMAVGGNGGGIAAYGHSTSISFTTIYGNQANSGRGGGLIVGSASTMFASIVAGNSAHTDQDIYGSLSSMGYNLIQDIQGVTILSPKNSYHHDMLGVNPIIDPMLQNNNSPGSPETHALLIGSPAIDLIPLDVCLGFPTTASILFGVFATALSGGGATDERGKPRPDGNEQKCDLGAYEYQQ